MQFSSACVSALLAPILVTAKLSVEFDERHLAEPLGSLGMELGTALDNLAVTRIEASKALTHVEENCIMSNDDLFAVSCIVR